MDVVEIRIVQVTGMMTRHTFREAFHPDFLPFFDDSPQRLVFDEAVAEVDDPFLMPGRDVVDRKVRTPEFSHPTGVKPRQAGFGLFGREDNRVVPGHRTPWLEYLSPPFLRLPPLKPKRIVDHNPALIEEEGQQAHTVPKVIERGAVLDFTTQDQANRRFNHLAGQVRLLCLKLFPQVTFLKTGQNIGVMLSVIPGQFQTVRDSPGTVFAR